MTNAVDYTGWVFGRLTVTSLEYIRKGHKYFRCNCQCGNEKIVCGSNLLNKHVTSCGCYNKEASKSRYKNLLGQKFNRLLCVEKTEISDGGPVWIFLCDCGKYTALICSELKKTKSCGCLVSEVSKQNAINNFTTQKGETHWNYKGGITGARHSDMGKSQYITWRKQVFGRDFFRCKICRSNKDIQAHHIESYKDYPELRYNHTNGITMCRKCHTEFHKKYGYINFDYADLLQFIYKERK